MPTPPPIDQAYINIYCAIISFHRLYQWTMVSSFSVIGSKPVKVSFRTNGSEVHIFRKQRLATRNWQPRHCLKTCQLITCLQC